ncbi:MAG: hypothetical protein IPG89_07115 [Bacteroidetes bacterium]|nr:hypothetical protein [Bacteroidota bacterium]
MEGHIFLSVKDLQKLLGSESYKTAHRLHLSLREALGRKSKYILIKEYCAYEGFEFAYIWEVLRGKSTPKPK